MAKLPDWDLRDLYKSASDKNIELDIQKSLKDAVKFEEDLSGKLKSLSGDKLASQIAKYEKISEKLGRLSTFAYLYFVTEMTNQKKSSFYQNIMEKINQVSINLLFFPLEIAKLTDAHLNKLYGKSKKLAKYKPYIRDVRAGSKYQKSKEIEKILHEKDQTSSHAWSRLFDETMAGLEFEFKSKKLHASEIFDLMSDKNKEVRKLASKAVGKTLGDNIQIFKFITNTLAKDKAIDDSIRNYPHPVKSRNISNFIEDEVVESLVDTTKKNYKKLSHEYYKLKAKIFGQKQLDYWDRNAPLPKLKESKISWVEASDIVLESYHEFSPEMAKIGKLFFDKNWIDVGPKKGKDSGAFSHPATTDTHPFIMLNFQGKLRDVMTLAHELGHGVHQYLARKQGYLMSDTPLTVAETASIFGEQLVFEKLLKNSKSVNDKKLLLSSKLEDSINSIIRQIAFFNFEFEVHTKRREKELTTEELNQIWFDVQKESLGPAIKFHDEYKYFWSYIPHFIHSPFYVYAYAFGNCLVNSLYASYKSGIKDFQKKYIEALTAGGTLHHIELLAPFKLDASKKDFWQKGLDIPISYLNDLKKLVK